MLRVVLIAVCGVVGTLVRYGVSQVGARHTAFELPWPTFVVNIAGAFMLGAIYAMLPDELPTVWRTAIGVGGLGALTTFSTFMFETMKLLEDGRFGAGVGYAFVTVVVGLAAMYAGTSLGKAL